MLVGAVACFVWEKMSFEMSSGIFNVFTKGGNDVKLKRFYTEKACKSFWMMQYFLASAIWGYVVLRPHGWLPWQIGGNVSLDEAWRVGAGAEMPYKKTPRSVHIYALATMGFHFGNIM